MKLKTDASGNAVLQDGKPVYVADDGKELALDAAALYTQVRTLTTEASAKRKALTEAESKLAQFEGIEDPKAAREALETVKGLDGKTRAEVEKVRSEVAKSFEPKISGLEKENAELRQSLHKELIGGGVARSAFLGKSAYPADHLLAIFGQQLSVENGVVTGKRKDGTPIYSRSNPGQLAGIDEALEVIVDESPHRDHILKATQKPGSGATPGAGGAGGGRKTMTRAQFEQLTPAERVTQSREGVQLTD